MEADLRKNIDEHSKTEEEFYEIKAAQINSKNARELAEVESLLSQQLRLVQQLQKEKIELRKELDLVKTQLEERGGGATGGGSGAGGKADAAGASRGRKAARPDPDEERGAKRVRINVREGLCVYPRESEMPHEILGSRLVESSSAGQPALKMLSLQPLHPEGAATVDVLKAHVTSMHDRFPHVWETYGCDERTEC